MSRRKSPWFRLATGRWYMTFEGRQKPLPVTDPKDVAGAWAAFQAVLSGATGTGRPEPLAALLPEFLSHHGRRVAPRTAQQTGYALSRFVARFGSVQAGQLDPEAVGIDASGEAWSDSHRSNYLWAVQAFVRWCGRKDFTLKRPAKESRGASAAISATDHADILRETTGDFHELCRVLWLTGARPMEVAGLEGKGIDWTSGTATLKRHKTKHKGRGRVLYFPPDALAILRRQADRWPDGAIFRGVGGKPFSRHAIVCRFLRVSAKLGRSVVAYGYRHGFITRALEQGIPDVQVSALVGHTSTAMLAKFYSHVAANGRLLREIAGKVAG